jgi:hypothetical protein
MNFKLLFLLIAAIVLAHANAFAGGSLPFADLKELLAEQPVLAKFVAEHLDVAEIGTASRIGGRVNEELSGSRVAPYEFDAKAKGATGDYNLMLIIEAETIFLDANGKKVRLEKATKIQERLTGIRLRLQTADER